ncbi:MAG: Hsp20/alpha crystallin family protein [Chloroflexi bacterium]|nr:Hsp20/alpha crystallin family protein [Chloroflexota bacterium]
MSITRWDPFAEFNAMRNVMDRVLEETFRRSPLWSGNGGDGEVVRPLPVDAYETPEALFVRAMVPGATPDQVNITFEQGTLTIRAHIPNPAEGQQGQEYHWLHHELGHGDFSRSLTLPGAWDMDHAEAQFAHGILTLRVPKAEAAKPLKIAVQMAQ